MTRQPVELSDVLNASRLMIEALVRDVTALQVVLLKKGYVTPAELNDAKKEIAAEAAVEAGLYPKKMQAVLRLLYGGGRTPRGETKPTKRARPKDRQSRVGRRRG